MRAALAHTLGAAGRTGEALQILNDLAELAKQKYVAPYFLAGIHVGLGESDHAIDYLEKAFAEHSHWLIYLHIDPSMDGLRDNPRFQDLLRRVGLPRHFCVETPSSSTDAPWSSPNSRSTSRAPYPVGAVEQFLTWASLHFRAPRSPPCPC